MKAGIVAAFALALLAGCASHTTAPPSASPGFSAFKSEQECTRNGGLWRPTLQQCVAPIEK